MDLWVDPNLDYLRSGTIRSYFGSLESFLNFVTRACQEGHRSRGPRRHPSHFLQYHQACQGMAKNSGLGDKASKDRTSP